MGLAYDDFGAGQARLFELAEAPPHYLKFDRRFVTGLDHAPTSRQRLVASLVAAARELLVKTVAEGVETAEEGAACMRAGFSHAQGYHFGRPAPVENGLRARRRAEREHSYFSPNSRARSFLIRSRSSPARSNSSAFAASRICFSSDLDLPLDVVERAVAVSVGLLGHLGDAPRSRARTPRRAARRCSS